MRKSLDEWEQEKKIAKFLDNWEQEMKTRKFIVFEERRAKIAAHISRISSDNDKTIRLLWSLQRDEEVVHPNHYPLNDANLNAILEMETLEQIQEKIKELVEKAEEEKRKKFNKLVQIIEILYDSLNEKIEYAKELSLENGIDGKDKKKLKTIIKKLEKK